jgi:hypothetical protein
VKKILEGILGLPKDSSEHVVIGKVKELIIELRGKMGYCSKSLLGKLLQEGYLSYNPPRNTYEIDADKLRELLKESANERK